MLEQVLRHINNRFDQDALGRPCRSASGSWSAAGGTLDVPWLKEGQYFWVEGSALNDGLHLHPADDMADEEFDGRVVALAIPGPVVELAEEIGEWCDANAKVLDSPYASESFGGYSYTKATGGSGGDGAGGGWQGHFAERLRPYRKLSRDWV